MASLPPAPLAPLGTSPPPSWRCPRQTHTPETRQVQRINPNQLQGTEHSLHRDVRAGGLFWFWASCCCHVSASKQTPSLNSSPEVLDLQQGGSPPEVLTTKTSGSQQKLGGLGQSASQQTLTINSNLEMSDHCALKISTTQLSKSIIQGLWPPYRFSTQRVFTKGFQQSDTISCT